MDPNKNMNPELPIGTIPQIKTEPVFEIKSVINDGNMPITCDKIVTEVKQEPRSLLDYEVMPIKQEEVNSGASTSQLSDDFITKIKQEIPTKSDETASEVTDDTSSESTDDDKLRCISQTTVVTDARANEIFDTINKIAEEIDKYNSGSNPNALPSKNGVLLAVREDDSSNDSEEKPNKRPKITKDLNFYLRQFNLLKEEEKKLERRVKKVTGNANRSGVPRPGTSKAGPSKPGTSKADAPRVDAVKVEGANADTPKADAPRADAPRADAPRADANKVETSRAETSKSSVFKPGGARVSTSSGTTRINGKEYITLADIIIIRKLKK